MATCIVNCNLNHAFILFEEKIQQGVILVFDSSHQFLHCRMISNSNSFNLELPNRKGKYYTIIYYDDLVMKKTFYVTEEHRIE